MLLTLRLFRSDSMNRSSPTITTITTVISHLFTYVFIVVHYLYVFCDIDHCSAIRLAVLYIITVVLYTLVCFITQPVVCGKSKQSRVL